jgi:hypothetical protein
MMSEPVGDAILKGSADIETHLYYKRHDPHLSGHATVSSPSARDVAENKRVQKLSV